MTVNNVKALGSLGTVQSGQTSVKPEEVVQERFDKLMDKMSGQLTATPKPQTGSVQTQMPKQTTVGNAQETAQPMDAVKTDNASQTAEAKKPEEASAEDTKNAVSQDGDGETAAVQEENAQDAEIREDVEEAAVELVEEVSKVMDIPLEKVEEDMEILGLTAVDLFDPTIL